MRSYRAPAAARRHLLCLTKNFLRLDWRRQIASIRVNIQFIVNIKEPSRVKTVQTLSTLKQLKALTDPLRLRLLEVFIQREATTKQAADILREKPTKLYHHAQNLEEAGLVRLVRTRRNRGTVEKYYRAVAEDFVVDRNLLELREGKARATRGYAALFLSGLKATLGEARRSVAAGLIRSVQAGVRNALLYRHQFEGSEAAMKAFTARVQEWIAECQAAEGGHGDVSYGLTIAFYPLAQRHDGRMRDKHKASAASKTAKSG
jgi:DNA-binding transcriptional ArsR family regulator